MNPSVRHVTRALTIAMALSLTLIAQVPNVAAATSPATFGQEDNGLLVGNPCVYGTTAPNGYLSIIWKNSHGTIKFSGDADVTEFGNWSACLPVGGLAVGDTIRASNGSTARKFTMPRVTIVVDRVADEIRGRAPANSNLSLYYHAGIFADYYEHLMVMSDSTGHYVADDVGDILGGIDATIEWHNAKGDYVDARGTAPVVNVTIGSATFSGSANPGKHVRFVSRDGSSDALLATGEATADEYGQFTGQFRDGEDDPVAVQAGDRLRAKPLASDFNWIVPDSNAHANVNNDHVIGACDNPEDLYGLVKVNVRRGGNNIGLAIQGLEGDGSFNIDFGGNPVPFFDPANIKHGDTLVVACLMATGDWVSQSFLVP